VEATAELGLKNYLSSARFIKSPRLAKFFVSGPAARKGPGFNHRPDIRETVVPA